MRWLTLALAMWLPALALAAGDLVVTTWNMKWFPSGRADLRISAEFERFKTKRAGAILSESVQSVGRTETDGLVILAEELRDADVCSNLVAACGIPGLRVAAVSRFLDKGGYPLWQQNAIFTTLDVVEAGAFPWQSERYVDMPRGCAYAVLRLGDDGLVACFDVHLKANVNYTGGTYETQKNIYKREYASMQILEKLRELSARYGESLSRVVVGGDFNTNEDDTTFVSEATLRAFYGAHFRSCFRGWRPEQRITHPASGGYPGCTFDYILYRGFGNIRSRRIGVGQPISDHHPVSVRLALEKRKRSGGRE